jgi:outer membrane immunogenic protein
MPQALRVALLVFSALGCCGVASAADMPLKAPPPPAPVYYNWSGFYLGVNLGGSWGHQSEELFLGGAPVAGRSNHMDGVIGGGQLGYNWQFPGSGVFGGNAWVLGLEADFQGSGQRRDDNFAFTGISGDLNDKLEWFGTVRGRAGVAFDHWLPYVTGGWAYGHRTLDGTIGTTTTTASFSNSNTFTDGWTVGGGVEWAFWSHWTAKLEYLYIDFGNNGSNANMITTPAVSITTGHLTDNIVRAGVNYKF